MSCLTQNHNEEHGVFVPYETKERKCITMATEDRRVRRSKRLLKQAIHNLINEKPYRDITVREITERADIGYMTFYRHFESKDHLLLYLTQTMLEEALEPYRHGNCQGVGRAVFQLVDQQRVLFGIILLDDAAHLVRRWLQDMIAQNMLNAPDLLPNDEHHAITNEIATMHFASSILNLITWWLDRKVSYSTVQMSQIYEQLMLEPTLKAVHTNPVPVT